MNAFLLAQAVVAGYSILTWVLIVVGLAVVFAIAAVVLKFLEVKIHPVLVKIFWIVVIGIFAILAIRLIWSLIF